jgi:hypothetical protein
MTTVENPHAPTLTEVLPAQLSSRHNAMKWTPTGPAAGLLTLDTKRDRVVYAVEELPCPDGRAFRFKKIDKAAGDHEGDLYTPFVGRVPQLDACDCKGFVFGRGRPCKHLLAARSLILNGWM